MSMRVALGKDRLMPAAHHPPDSCTRCPTRMVGIPMAVLAVLLGAALLAFTDAPRHPLFPRCLSQALLGLHCAGCGTTRALTSLLHGELRQAWAYNPLALLLLPPMGMALVDHALARLRNTAPRLPMPSATIQWTLLAVIVFYTLLRNLPYPLFDTLRPHVL